MRLGWRPSPPCPHLACCAQGAGSALVAPAVGPAVGAPRRAGLAVGHGRRGLPREQAVTGAGVWPGVQLGLDGALQGAAAGEGHAAGGVLAQHGQLQRAQAIVQQDVRSQAVPALGQRVARHRGAKVCSGRGAALMYGMRGRAAVAPGSLPPAVQGRAGSPWQRDTRALAVVGLGGALTTSRNVYMRVVFHTTTVSGHFSTVLLSPAQAGQGEMVVVPDCTAQRPGCRLPRCDSGWRREAMLWGNSGHRCSPCMAACRAARTSCTRAAIRSWASAGSRRCRAACCTAAAACPAPPPAGRHRPAARPAKQGW